MGDFRRRDFLRTLGAGGAGLALGSPLLMRSASAAGNAIVLGGSVPMSGPYAETGLNVLNGYRAAIKHINDDLGGVKVAGKTYRLELKLFDDASDPSRATTLIQKQLDQGVQFFLGSFGSKIVLPTCAITDRARKPMVQAGGGSDLIFTQGRRYVFGIFPRASRQFISSIKFFESLEPKVKTISIIYTNDPFSKFQANGANKGCQDAGIKVLDFVQLPSQVSDVSAVLASVRNNRPDILVTNTHDEISILIAKQMISSGTNVNMLYQTLGPQTAAYRETLGKYANTVVTQTYWDEHTTYSGKVFASPKAFADYYRAHFKRPLVYHMASGAACVVSYLLAMQNANSLEPEAVRNALAALDVETFYGHIRFTKDGDGDAVTMGAKIAQIQNDKVEVVFPQAGASAPPIYPSPPWKART